MRILMFILGIAALYFSIPFLILLVNLPVHGQPDYSEKDKAVFARLVAEQEARNATIRVPFDPSRHVLIGESIDERVAMNYNLGVVYRDKPNGYEKRPTSLRLLDEAACRIARQSDILTAAGAETSTYQSIDGRGQPMPQLTECVMRLPEEPDPSKGKVRLSLSTHDAELSGIKVSLFNQTIAMPDGTVTKIATVASVHGGGGPEAEAALAKALGLRWTAPDRRRRVDASALQGLIAAADARLRPAQADGDDSRTFAGLERAIGSGRDGQAAATAFADQIAKWPEARLHPFRSRILALYEKELSIGRGEPDATNRSPSRPLAPLDGRLGELGKDALPILVELTPWGLDQRQLISACVFGEDARLLLGQKLLKSWGRANESQTYTKRVRRLNAGLFRDRYYDQTIVKLAELDEHGALLYVTLLRMGLRAQAEPLAKHVDANALRQKFATISPRSPAEVCTGNFARH